METVNSDCRVRPEGKKCRRPEVYVTAIATKNVPRRRQHDILQNDITGEEIIIVAECERGGKDDAGDDEANEQKEI